MERSNSNSPLRVTVLTGGWSNERQVSLETGHCVSAALTELGHQVTCIDPDPNLTNFLQQLNQTEAELIFNALHGKWGEDGTLQGILDTLGIPYTGSGIAASALAWNKKLSRQIATAAAQNVQIPPGQLMTMAQYKVKGHVGHCHFPHVIKPVTGGSSVGVKFIQNIEEWSKFIARQNSNEDEEILVENYIPGRELTVSVFNGVAAGVLELRFDSKIFDYECKYTKGKTTHIVPAPVPPTVYQLAMECAEKMHKAMNCVGVTRSDFRYDDTATAETGSGSGLLYYLETNTLPGLTKLSLVPEMAQIFKGWEFKELVQWILDQAFKK